MFQHWDIQENIRKKKRDIQENKRPRENIVELYQQEWGKGAIYSNKHSYQLLKLG